MGLSFKNMKKALEVAVTSGRVLNIVGLQGIGKSDLVREFARENNYGFAEITCSLIQEGDLAMPYISEEGGEKKVSYAVNKIITDLCENSNNRKKKYSILFLDEFNRANAQVQSELMNLVLQREIVGYKLYPNVRVVLAMNPNSDMEGYEGTDYSVSYSDSAIMGRIISVDLIPNLSDWLEYGKTVVEGRAVVHEVITKYLSANVSAFITKEKPGRVNNTPRAWSMASDILYAYENTGVKSMTILSNMLKGVLESSYADSLVDFYKKCANSVDYFEIAKSVLYSTSTDDWDVRLLTMNDAELDVVYKSILSLVGNKAQGKEIDNIVTFILSATKELAYSWIETISKNNVELYTTLLENEDFVNYVMDILVNIKSTEVGGFSGK